jgi:hypothetical protein
MQRLKTKSIDVNEDYKGNLEIKFIDQDRLDTINKLADSIKLLAEGLIAAPSATIRACSFQVETPVRI